MTRRLALAAAALVFASCVATAQPALALARVVRVAHHLRGHASWFAAAPGTAAAGPALRRLLGSDWRGSRVKVCRGRRCIVVRLTDWCQCYKGTRSERAIDLSRADFARLEHISRGTVWIRIREIPRYRPTGWDEIERALRQDEP